MKHIFFLLLALSAFMISPLRAESRPLVVVELFTSQGCSSCPPADAFLGELAMRSDVLALAYHVDYWDYIGWRDVHGDRSYSDRQRRYAQAFDLRYVYTPQMIVDGVFETSGNQRRDITSAIDKQLKNGRSDILEYQDGMLIVDASQSKEPLNLMYVEFIKEETTKVRRGENRGRDLTEYHIVTKLEKIAALQGERKSLPIIMKSQKSPIGAAVFVQNSKTMKIISAHRLY